MISNCPNCMTGAPLRLRDFSSHAQATLVARGDLSSDAVGKPICQPCYQEMRDILVDHENESISHARKLPFAASESA